MDPGLPEPLRDPQGRAITYLRLSLTDRCNLRCSYCTAGRVRPEGAPLRRDEIRRLVGALAGLGIRRVRLTGGEPTLRHDLLDVVADVAAVPGVEEIALTTNGHRLEELARPLRAAGVARLNVSLDTLDGGRLARICGRGLRIERLLAGLEAAAGAGFASLKLNAVVLRGENEDEAGDLVRFAWRIGALPRFIELMPFGQGTPVPAAELRALLAAQGVALEPDARRGWGPAVHMRGTVTDGGGTRTGLVGFIAPMTENFCDGCNRIRVSADGALRACLAGRERTPLRDLLAEGADPALLAERVRGTLAGKAARHAMADGERPAFPMVASGG
jgi:cyclic pyranopterin phosphate synthase